MINGEELLKLVFGHDVLKHLSIISAIPPVLKEPLKIVKNFIADIEKANRDRSLIQAEYFDSNHYFEMAWENDEIFNWLGLTAMLDKLEEKGFTIDPHLKGLCERVAENKTGFTKKPTPKKNAASSEKSKPKTERKTDDNMDKKFIILIAKNLLGKNKDMTKAQMLLHRDIIDADLINYHPPKTLDGWISYLFPKKKPGRPKNVSIIPSEQSQKS